MRVLHLSDVYFPRINGVSTSIETLREALASAGHDSVLVAPRYGGENGERDVVRVPSRPVPWDPEDRWMHARPIWRMGPELVERGFTVVHVHTPFVAHVAGSRLARRLGLPVVASYHTFFEEYLGHYVRWVPAGWLRALARRAARRQCDSADAVVVPSVAMQDVLVRYGVGSPMVVIPTGLAPGPWSSGDGQRFRARHGISPTRPVLVHVGRIAFEKNVGFLVEVLAEVRREVPDVLLVLAGEGPATASLWRRIGELGLARHVLGVGYLERGVALADCYRAGDVFVFASRTETQGLVLLEAMALGVPVVSTCVLGTRDILAAGRGAVISPESVDAFAAHTIDLLRDHARRAALGREASEHARGWTAAGMAARMAALYATVADPGARSRESPPPRARATAAAP